MSLFRGGRPRLIVACGIPGSGKSTLAQHVVSRWEAVSFASETFADQLGAAARTFSGDLSTEAILHAYAAMGAAVADALAKNKLVVSVGSFRSEEQRTRFRHIAKKCDAAPTLMRIVCPLQTAAKRIQARRAVGERGPSETAICEIDTELNRASDIDIVLSNDSTIEAFYGNIDAVIRPLIMASMAVAEDNMGQLIG
jgi:predicted kinase